MLPSALLLFLAYIALAQQFSPSVAPEVVDSTAVERATKRDSTACDAACATLAARFEGQVFLGKTGNYSFWSEQAAELEPACRVEPADAQDLSVFYRTIKHHKCHFAVKSGGHVQHPGANNADGGITIDLARLDNVDIAPDKKTVNIGSGNRWGRVYQILEKEGLYVLGGRVADVGVGGIVLGGGLNFFSSKEGFACDSVLKYQIVMPDSKVQIVTQQNAPDLFKALKGAGQSNFGIVTQVTLELSVLPNPAGIWFTSRTFLAEKISQFYDVHHQYLTEVIHSHPTATGQFQVWSWVPDYSFMLTVQQFDTDWKDANSTSSAFKSYESIESIPSQDDTEMLLPSELSERLASLNPYGWRNDYATFTYKPSAELEEKLYVLYQEAIEKLKVVESWGYCTVLQPIAKDAIKHTSKHGGNVLGFAPDDGPLVIYLLPWAWKHAKDDAYMREVQQDLVAKSEAAAKEMGLWHPFKYINYAASWQPVYEGYGEANLKFLKSTQRKYDPEHVFTKGGLAGGFFKLNENTKGHKPQIRDEL